MTQNGIVTKLLDRGWAEVSVERGTACGEHCDGCETCIYATQLLVQAENTVYAGPGDRVILESASKSIMGAALLVYMLPIVLLFAGYAGGAAAGLAQSLCILTSLVGLLLGVGLAVFFGRRKKEIVFRIVGFQR